MPLILCLAPVQNAILLEIRDNNANATNALSNAVVVGTNNELVEIITIGLEMMQNRYTGDIGDYAKYGLLRALANDRRLGVAWYLFPDEDHNADGRHVNYLRTPGLWRARDPELFDTLMGIVEEDRRSVADVEESGILNGAKFSSEILFAPKLSPTRRGTWRSQWFEDTQSALKGCDVVFADPDNGLYEDSKFRIEQTKHWKRIPLSEAKALAQGRTAIIYHHNTRRKGGHEREIRYWMDQLGADTLALRWRAYSNRTFFVISPAPNMYERIRKFAYEWGPKAELYC